MKIHFYGRFKIDVLGTSQGRLPTDVFSECYEDVRRTFLPNFKNEQQLAFKYFMQHIWKVGSKLIQQ